MINILMPLGGESLFFKNSEYLFPKPLIEIGGKTIVEIALQNYTMIKAEKHYIFVVNKSDCEKYYLDDVVKLLTDNNSSVIALEKPTKGSACSCLMAIEQINNDNELLIVNSDQLFNINIDEVLSKFRSDNVDCGVMCFNAIHPRWSYARIGEKDSVIETAEKRPISKWAIAGFYYFKAGRLFVDAAMKSIRRNASVNEVYYVAPVINELVLDNRNIKIYKLRNKDYYSFYSPDKIKEYKEKRLDD